MEKLCILIILATCFYEVDEPLHSFFVFLIKWNQSQINKLL